MIGTPSKSIEQGVFISLRRLVQALRVQARRGHLGLSGAQAFALRRLGSADRPLSLKELAEATLTDVSSISVVVKRLEARGLVWRRTSPGDARAIQLGLRPAGKRQLRRLRDSLQERLRASLDRMSPAQRRSLDRALKDLLEGAGLSDAAAPFFFEPPD